MAGDKTSPPVFRDLTAEERIEMERLTRETHAEIQAALDERPQPTRIKRRQGVGGAR
jgi:hypothetical protein